MGMFYMLTPLVTSESEESISDLVLIHRWWGMKYKLPVTTTTLILIKFGGDR